MNYNRSIEVQDELATYNLPDDILDIIEKTAISSDELAVLEIDAVELIEKGQKEVGLDLLFNADYEQHYNLIESYIDEFEVAIEEWTNDRARNAATTLNIGVIMIIAFLPVLLLINIFINLSMQKKNTTGLYTDRTS